MNILNKIMVCLEKRGVKRMVLQGKVKKLGNAIKMLWQIKSVQKQHHIQFSLN